MKIWDTAGMERFKAISHGYYKNSDGVIILFDITDRTSFNRISNWFTALITHASEDVPKILIGCKSDLYSDRVVSFEEGTQLATKLGITYRETSSKTNFGIKETFEEIIEKSIVFKQNKILKD